MSDEEWGAKFARYIALSVEEKLAEMGLRPEQVFTPKALAVFDAAKSEAGDSDASR